MTALSPAETLTAPELLLAPWTPEQVAALNAFQHCGQMHPFTCGRQDSHSFPNRGRGVLTAFGDGWRCPATGCAYRQNWAHAFTATGPWPRPEFLGALLGHAGDS